MSQLLKTKPVCGGSHYMLTEVITDESTNAFLAIVAKCYAREKRPLEASTLSGEFTTVLNCDKTVNVGPHLNSFRDRKLIGQSQQGGWLLTVNSWDRLGGSAAYGLNNSQLEYPLEIPSRRKTVASKPKVRPIGIDSLPTTGQVTLRATIRTNNGGSEYYVVDGIRDSKDNLVAILRLFAGSTPKFVRDLAEDITNLVGSTEPVSLGTEAHWLKSRGLIVGSPKTGWSLTALGWDFLPEGAAHYGVRCVANGQVESKTRNSRQLPVPTKIARTKASPSSEAESDMVQMMTQFIKLHGTLSLASAAAKAAAHYDLVLDFNIRESTNVQSRSIADS